MMFALISFQESSVLPLAKNFKNDSFLLVHGTGDGKLHHLNFYFRGLFVPSARRAQGTMLSCVRVRP